MIACYDLARCPPTYDVVAFLAHAEIERQRVGADDISIRILPGPAGGFRRDDLWPRSVAERLKLQRLLLVPLCRLLPTVREVRVGPLTADDIKSGGPHPFGAGERLISLRFILTALRARCRPLHPRLTAPRWRGLITFTLREAEHHPLRNSRTAEWVAAAEELRMRGHNVVVIRDTARADDKLERVPCAALASRDVTYRAALYAQATLNVGICNGPMWMAVFMGAPVLMLRPTTNAAGGCYDDRFYAQCGLSPGSQLPTSPPHQRLAWVEDVCENIVHEVSEMLMAVAA